MNLQGLPWPWKRYVTALAASCKEPVSSTTACHEPSCRIVPEPSPAFAFFFPPAIQIACLGVRKPRPSPLLAWSLTSSKPLGSYCIIARPLAACLNTVSAPGPGDTPDTFPIAVGSVIVRPRLHQRVGRGALVRPSVLVLRCGTKHPKAKWCGTLGAQY